MDGSSEDSSSGGGSSNNGSAKDDSSQGGGKSESSSENKPNDNASISEIISGTAPILGERGTENIGLAVLKDGVYIGDLTAADTLCHTLISGEVNSFLLGIDNKELYPNYIDVSLYENVPPKIKVDISGDKPKISIKLKLNGRIDGIKTDINYSENSSLVDLNEISETVNKCLKAYILDYLNKTTSVFNCDIDYFFTDAKRSFVTIEDWKRYDWAEKYKNCEFDVTVESQVYHSLLKSD